MLCPCLPPPGLPSQVGFKTLWLLRLQVKPHNYPPPLAPDQALQAQAHIVVRMGMPMDGRTKRWLAQTRIAQRTIAGMCPTPVRRTLMEMG